MRSCSLVFRFAWGIAALFVWLCASAAAETLTPDQIRAAMQAERSKIMSGRLVAHGRFLYSGYPMLDGAGRISWKYVFDYADDYFLFDRSEPRRPDYPPFDGAARLRTFFAEDRDASYAYQNRVAHEASLRVYGRDNRNNAPDNRFKRLSVRGIGFYNGPNMLDLSEIGDRIFFEHSYASEIRVEQESENILKLWFNDPGEPDGPDADKSCLWVDKSRGFIPIRAASTTNGEISMDSRTEWKIIDQVWVPTRLTGNSRVASLPDGAEDIKDIEHKILEFELDITWESLNESVGTGKLHDLREFDLPKGTRAVKGRVVHRYGYELPVRKPAAPKPAGENKLLISLLFLGSLLLVVSFTIWATGHGPV